MTYLPQDWLSWIDILIISALVYFVLRRIRSTRRPKATVFILAVSTVIFVGAKFSGLALTSQVIDVLLWLGAVAFIVLFQEDIRRELELVFLPKKLRQKPQKRGIAAVLTSAVKRLADQRTGGLILLESEVPVAEHSNLGITLNGAVSEPLLLSLFDHHSPGHDGAVLIRGSKVVSFGLHLPLSRSSLSGRLGTRHAAALGISERTDCLVICVSEEDGGISLARFGELRQLDADALDTEIANFYGNIGEPSKSWLDLIIKPALTGAVALLISLISVNIYTSQSVRVLREVSLPISFSHLGDTLGMGAIQTDMVSLRLEGDTREVDRFLKQNHAVEINLQGYEKGVHDISIPSSIENLPKGVRITHSNPSSVQVQVYAYRQVEVPVAILCEPHEGPHQPTPALAIEPDKVTIEVREGDPGPAIIETAPVDMLALRKAGTLTTALSLPQGARFVDDKSPEVKILLLPTTRTRAIASDKAPAKK